ncbi:hypothetical protein [Longimicrobium sp.]|jgi:hypothetical protein|uniref:hypothetical protein n=1 Tax=Longimicrobium sp. TaxID=2029185 RepID=UPI002F94EB94
MNLSVEIAASVASLLSGLFGGAGATLLWELYLKPRRERKSVGRTIAGETSLNLQLIALQLAAGEHNPGAVPSDFRLSTLAFEALASSIGELPTEPRQLVILLYNRVQYLNRLVDLYSHTVDKLRETPGESPAKVALDREARAASEAFYRILERTFETANATIVALHSTIEGPFSRESRLTGDFDEVRARVHQGLKERDQRLGPD